MLDERANSPVIQVADGQPLIREPAAHVGGVP